MKTTKEALHASSKYFSDNWYTFIVRTFLGPPYWRLVLRPLPRGSKFPLFLTQPCHHITPLPTLPHVAEPSAPRALLSRARLRALTEKATLKLCSISLGSGLKQGFPAAAIRRPLFAQMCPRELASLPQLCLSVRRSTYACGGESQRPRSDPTAAIRLRPRQLVPRLVYRSAMLSDFHFFVFFLSKGVSSFILLRCAWGLEEGVDLFLNMESFITQIKTWDRRLFGL